MDGIEGHFAKWNKSDRESLYDNFTFMWNSKNNNREDNKKEVDSQT